MTAIIVILCVTLGLTNALGMTLLFLANRNKKNGGK